MNQSTTFAQVATNLLNVLQGYSKTIRLLLVMFLTLTVSAEVWAETITDKISASDLKATNTTYTAFSNVSKSSDAIYAGQSAKDASGNIQLRSKNSNSGIVSTTSGGKVKSVKINVGSGTNTVDVYGSNTVYTAASDLYGNNKGTKIGSLTATGTITFNDDYAYVGIRSNNGAIYLSSIEIVWEVGSSCTEPTITTQPTGATYAKDATATALKVVATGDDLTYQWYSNTSNSTSGATTINNATNSTFTPATSTVGTKYYYCIVSSGSCSTTSNIVSVVISPTYTVTYNANGATSGTVPTDATKYNGGATVTVKGNSGNLAKTGYTFAGWNTKADGTGTTYAAGTGTFTISSNTTLYAKWTANTYTVTWIVDGVTKRTDTGVAYNTSKTAPTVSPIPCGDVIAGWTDAVDGNYEHGTSTLHSGATPSITITSDKTFYAVFADYAD